VDDAAHRRAVAAAVDHIRKGDADKVVLARDLMAVAAAPLDERHLLTQLAQAFPTCWAFAVNGLVGATPELLLSREDAMVYAQPLAGTVWARAGSDGDALAHELVTSAKNRAEHAYAVRSLLESLRPLCCRLEATPEPSVLRLPNVMHLATEIRGTLSAGASLLDLLARVHPTAAVGGWPTAAALQLIGQLEGMDRRGYLGPVGWLDHQGNGEAGVALRCAQVDGATARRFAGGGIVADSDPATEAAEVAAKLRAMQFALPVMPAQQPRRARPQP
jgi:menaquinone-specific isochorismate synthase